MEAKVEEAFGSNTEKASGPTDQLVIQSNTFKNKERQDWHPISWESELVYLNPSKVLCSAETLPDHNHKVGNLERVCCFAQHRWTMCFSGLLFDVLLWKMMKNEVICHLCMRDIWLKKKKTFLAIKVKTPIGKSTKFHHNAVVLPLCCTTSTSLIPSGFLSLWQVWLLSSIKRALQIRGSNCFLKATLKWAWEPRIIKELSLFYYAWVWAHLTKWTETTRENVEEWKETRYHREWTRGTKDRQKDRRENRDGTEGGGSCDGVRPRWKEAPVLPAGLACFTAIILTWPAAHTRRLHSFGRPQTVTGVFSLAKVGFSFPSRHSPPLPCILNRAARCFRL